ncbi:MAG: hypothetical protein QW231_02505 [Candidatus Bathyarchaeia archaeon]
MFGGETEYYCGHCRQQPESNEGNCPRCGAPLSMALVAVNKREREWINSEEWSGERLAWIQAQFHKFPRYEEWLYNNERRSLSELGPDEIKKTVEEYKKALEERNEQIMKFLEEAHAKEQKKNLTTIETEKGRPKEKAVQMSDEDFKKFLIDKLESLDKNIKQLAENLKEEKEKGKRKVLKKEKERKLTNDTAKFKKELTEEMSKLNRLTSDVSKLKDDIRHLSNRR